MEAPEIKIKHDREVNIATGQNKATKRWKNKPMGWGELLGRLARPTITQETVNEYQKMSKTKRDGIKDVGGFVGGFLKGGRRKADAVQNRSLVTLDADSVKGDLWDSVEMMYDFAAALYSTHSHTPEKPRVRLIIPLARPVTAEEYQPLARKLADKFGMDNFDDTTYQPERLMFWPSCSRDAEYVFEYQDGDWLNPDSILAEYPDWTDSSYWPESSRSHGIRERQAKKQGDPLEKSGVIGAFCRTYDIRSAIEKFLEDVYVETDKDDRFTYTEGSTSGGLIVYEDKFAYSHHGTDPIGDTLCNAFDLVRVHRFGDQDEDVKDGTPANRLPSFKAMREFALEDKEVKGVMVADRMQEAAEEFDDDYIEEADQSWTQELELDINGSIEASAKNLELIFENDPNLSKKCAIDQFANRVALKADLPWRKLGEYRFWKDSDDSGLRIYIEKVYGIAHKGKIEDAFTQEIEKRAYHPVRDYLDTLEWDGEKRVESLLVDYLGAEDTRYVRTVTKKTLVAAIARIYVPGIKFDTMLSTTGPQGIGKSFLPGKLAGAWFSDSLDSVTGKDAYEALQGAWILEMAEMTATKKADIEAVKQFLSKREDIYRVAYGKHKSYFKRQCIFWGTSNDQEFLRDKTGGRRFWPVDVGVHAPKYRVWEELTDSVRDQIWAEAKDLWENGETIFLNPEEEALAKEQQALHTEDNALEGMVQEYLDILVPDDWYELDRFERRQFIKNSGGELTPKGTMRRTQACVMEIWCELLDGDPKSLIPIKSKELHSIISRLDGWEKYTSGTGKLRFGKDYGAQRAYVRN